MATVAGVGDTKLLGEHGVSRGAESRDQQLIQDWGVHLDLSLGSLPDIDGEQSLKSLKLSTQS